MASRQSLIWCALIVAYGIFIPNTARRCTTVVGLLAATPIVTAAISNSLFGGISPRLMTAYLFNLAIWMVYASALAIYGSHRIDVLRKQALEARKLGQYQLKRLLGVGGMGEVYLAEHLLLRRPCAIKLIRRDRAGDAESLLRFEREVQATATLTHPNTVQVYDYGHTDDGTFYYVMEYLPGLTLEELVHRNGPTPASRTIHLLRQICGALREAHARGLIHRDIKPANIIVGERGGLPDVAKLLDFGIVRRLDRLRPGTETFRGEVMGTPIFMSPEQATGTEPVDAISDIYSLGGVAYFLLTGVPPFLRATASETLEAHMRDAVVPPDRIQPEVPGDLQAIVLRCLSKKRDDRYQSAEALNDALARCANSRP
jgi:serine/threonine-protein kinase